MAKVAVLPPKYDSKILYVAKINNHQVYYSLVVRN